MGDSNTLEQVVGWPSSRLTPAQDSDMTAFISNLIEQNAELTQKLKELASQKKLEDEIVAEVQQRADVLSLLAEKEWDRRAAAIISDAEEKARAEAVSILADATRQVEATRALKEKQANDRASAIIEEAETGAKIEADKILSEAKQRAEGIIEQKRQFAIQQGLLIINKAEEKAVSILEDVRKQVEAIAASANKKVRV